MATNFFNQMFNRNPTSSQSISSTNGNTPSTKNIHKFNNTALQLELLRERITELQLELEDRGWTHLGDVSAEAWEFDRSAIKSICRLSRLYFLKNPIINRGVAIQAVYVWGQGVEISARDANISKIVKRFIENPGNQAELTSHKARVLKECDLQVDGNIFFALFTNPNNGAVSVRTLPLDQVDRIIHNPQDRKDPWFYKRIAIKTDLKTQFELGNHGQETIYYPDWRLDMGVTFPSGLPQLAREARYDANVKIFHVKVGGLSEMQFGVPETYQAIDWARAYKEFLEDWATIVKSLSRFAWKMTGPAHINALAAAQSALGTTVTVENEETNPPPAAGSVFYESGDFNLQAMPKTGATIQADDGRRLLLMALAGLGIPETFTGDVSVGTLATAESLDRPTELKFRDRQTLWGDTLRDILQFVIERAAEAGYLGLELRRIEADDDDDARFGVFKDGEEIDTYVDINFPPILERDVKKIVESVVTAATLDGKIEPSEPVIPRREVSRKLMQAIDVGDVDGQLKLLYPEPDESDSDNQSNPNNQNNPELEPAPNPTA